MSQRWIIGFLAAVGAIAALAVVRRRGAAAAVAAQPATSPAIDPPAQSELLPVARGAGGRFVKRTPAPAGVSSAELAEPPSAN